MELKPEEASTLEKEILKRALGVVKGKGPEAMAAVINLIKSSKLLLPDDLSELLQQATEARENAIAEEKIKLGEIEALEATKAFLEKDQAKWNEHVNKTYEEFKGANTALASQHKTESKLLEDILEEAKTKNGISHEALEKLHAHIEAHDEKAEQENWRKLAEARRIANFEQAWRKAEKQKIETEASKAGIDLHDEKQKLANPLAIKKEQFKKEWDDHNNAIKKAGGILEEVNARYEEGKELSEKYAKLIEICKHNTLDKYIETLDKRKNILDERLITINTGATPSPKLSLELPIQKLETPNTKSTTRLSIVNEEEIVQTPRKLPEPTISEAQYDLESKKMILGSMESKNKVPSSKGSNTIEQIQDKLKSNTKALSKKVDSIAQKPLVKENNKGSSRGRF